MKDWKDSLQKLSGADALVLRNGIRVLAQAAVPRHRLALHEQPFDSALLRASPLFRRSRKLFLAQGGGFYPTLVSSPRTLSSPALLEQRIEYSPLERELIWAATDPIESSSRSLNRLMSVRTYCTSLFHEQNHRLLWRFLPPPPRSRADASRYLNFVESLVVTLDMALGDELGAPVSKVFYLAGALYDPGTGIRKELRSGRLYRNYLHACLHATFLKLEFYRERDIRKAVHALFPGDRELVARATRRALHLDDEFVRRTNPAWQRRHLGGLIRAIGASPDRALVFPGDPLKNHLHYLWAERFFDRMKI